MINKQRKPRPGSFHWAWLLFTLSYFYKETKICFTIATNRQIRTVTNAKVLFFKTFQLYNTDGALFNFY